MKTIEKQIIVLTSNVLGMIDACPVIYYHDVVQNGQGYSYQKTEYSNFESQIRYIAENGLNSYTFSDIDNEPTLLNQKKNVIICFDDGYQSNYSYAFPIFKKYNIKFNIFIEAGAIKESKKDYLTEDNIREMFYSGIVGIGAHTWSHLNCIRLDSSNFASEILNSNQYLSSLIGERPINDFCFPFGVYNSNALKVLDDWGGYKRLYTSDNARKKQMMNSSVIGRIGIENSDSIEDFKNKALGRFASYRIYKALKL